MTKPIICDQCYHLATNSIQSEYSDRINYLCAKCFAVWLKKVAV